MKITNTQATINGKVYVLDVTPVTPFSHTTLVTEPSRAHIYHLKEAQVYDDVEGEFNAIEVWRDTAMKLWVTYRVLVQGNGRRYQVGAAVYNYHKSDAIGAAFRMGAAK